MTPWLVHLPGRVGPELWQRFNGGREGSIDLVLCYIPPREPRIPVIYNAYCPTNGGNVIVFTELVL
jgi:hypothetical protein